MKENVYLLKVLEFLREIKVRCWVFLIRDMTLPCFCFPYVSLLISALVSSQVKIFLSYFEQHCVDSKLNQNCSLKFTCQLMFPQTGCFELRVF